MNDELEKAEELKILHLKNLCESKTCPFCISEIATAKKLLKESNFKKIKKWPPRSLRNHED
jgi:hypothetical protein